LISFILGGSKEIGPVNLEAGFPEEGDQTPLLTIQGEEIIVASYSRPGMKDRIDPSCAVDADF
jgi:hypothetical protein